MTVSGKVLPEFSAQSLTGHNTFALPCQALKVATFKQTRQALETLAHWPESERPFVLGEGSNLIVPAMLANPIIRLATQNIRFEPIDRERTRVSAEAGVRWDDLVAACVTRGLRGIENLSWIPGTVGAAPVQNIGAYGVELSDSLVSVQIFDFEQKQSRTMLKSECAFSYRDSLFKRNPGRFVILEIELELSTNTPFSLAYGELKPLQNTMDSLDVASVRAQVIKVRQAKLPDPDDIPNAGSFFKNPVVGSEHLKALLQTYPKLVNYALPDGTYKLAAGWMIEQAGWKGFRGQHVGVHSRQALVLVNLGGAGQRDVLDLAEKIQSDIAQKFGVSLDIEPIVLSSENA